MPSQQEHVTKAEGNAAFAMSLPLTSQTNIDWVLIVLFYAAIHYVEAYLAKSGQHTRSHSVRDNIIARDASLRKIYKEFGHLKYFGYTARYEVAGFKAKDVTAEAIPYFEIVKNHLKGIL